MKKRYTGRGIEHVDVRVVHGKARLKHGLYLLGYTVINTSVVERHKGTSRWRNQRKVRKRRLCRKLCSGGHEGAVALSCGGDYAARE